MTRLLSTYEDALRVTADGAGASHAQLAPSWRSWTGPHGGLLAGLALRAAEQVLGPERPVRALTAQFLRSAGQGRLDLRTSAVHTGGSSAVVTVTAGAPGAPPAVLATVTGGRSRGAGAPLERVPAPAVPGPDQCPELAPPVDLVPFAQHTELRAAVGMPMSGGLPELVAWVRLRAGGPLDAAVLAVLTDVMPPALYGALSTPLPVPTVELSVTLTDAPPADGWVLCRIRCRTASGGWAVDDSEVWDGDGRLLASGRQTRRVLGDLS